MEIKIIDRAEKTKRAISEFLGKDIDIKLNNKELILNYKDKDFCFICIDHFLRIIIYPINIIFNLADATADFYTMKELADILIILSNADKKKELLEIVKENYIKVYV